MSRTPVERQRISVARFEGGYAVVVTEGGATADIPRWLLPAGAGEGEAVEVVHQGDSTVLLRVDRAATARGEVEAILTRLRDRAAGV